MIFCVHSFIHGEGSEKMNHQIFEERIQTFIERRQKEAGTINAMMKMHLVSSDYDQKTVVLAFGVESWQMNPAGNMHGGMLATALDITMGCAAYTSIEATFTPTISMSLNFVSSVKAGDVLEIEGICDHVGSRLAQVRGIARVHGKVVATANGSYVINNR